MPPNGDDWNQWRNHVLSELERLERIEVIVGEIKVEIARLQIKAGVWGLMAGAVPVVIMLAIQNL